MAMKTFIRQVLKLKLLSRFCKNFESIRPMLDVGNSSRTTDIYDRQMRVRDDLRCMLITESSGVSKCLQIHNNTTQQQDSYRCINGTAIIIIRQRACRTDLIDTIAPQTHLGPSRWNTSVTLHFSLNWFFA